MDRINGGESFFTRENFLVTLGAFVVINVYAFVSFILMVITVEKMHSGIKFQLVLIEFFAALMFAFSNPWLQFGA